MKFMNSFAENGRVFSFGYNEWGQLGLGHRESINKPSCIKSKQNQKNLHSIS